MKDKFFSYIKSAIAIVKLEKGAMTSVASNKDATVWGVVILLVPPVLNVILAALGFPSGIGVIFSRFLLWPMFVPVLSVVGSVFVMSLLAEKSFKGKSDHLGFFRTLAFSSVVLWLSVIPFILANFGIFDAFGLFNLVWVAGVFWMLVVAYKMLIFHHGLKEQDAVVVVVIGVVCYVLLSTILGRVLVGRSYRFLY